MATLKAPFALDRSLNTTEENSRNIADVLADELSRITGRNASQVEYDNTESGLDAENVQDALDEIVEDIPTVPTVDIQTAVDEFETYNGGILDSLKVSLSPNQYLHGYDSPWVGGAGKNKCEQTVDKIKSLNTSGTWNGNAYTWNGITYTILTDDANNVIGYDVDGTATARGWLFISDTNLGNADAIYNGGYVNGYLYTSDNPNFAVGTYHCWYSSSQIKSYILVDVGLTKNHDKWFPMARLDTVDDPTFEPYSNICPISGHTQVDVDVSDGDTTQEQITVNLGGTYYSGVLDVVTGVFTPDKKGINLSDIGWSGSNGAFCSTNPISDIKHGGGRYDYAMSSGYKTANKASLTQLTDGEMSVDASAYLQIKDNQYTASASFVSDRGSIQIVYELANPTPIQLSPTTVKALVGENHLSAPLEGQEITESKYKQMFTFDDVIAYIQSLS